MSEARELSHFRVLEDPAHEQYSFEMGSVVVAVGALWSCVQSFGDAGRFR